MIPGWLISLLTFPGVIIHEYAHEKMCVRRKVPVYEVCYFRIGNPAGYVKHGRTENFGDTFAISVAPFLINSLVAILFSIPLMSLVFISAESQAIDQSNLGLNLLALVILWLGISTGMHAIPSSTDAKNIWRHAKQEWRKSIKATLGLPIAAFIYMGDKLRFFWFDAIYAILLMLPAGILAEFIVVTIFS